MMVSGLGLDGLERASAKGGQALRRSEVRFLAMTTSGVRAGRSASDDGKTR